MRILLWMGGSFDRRTPSEHLLTAIVEALYAKGHSVYVVQKDTFSGQPHLPAALEQLGVETLCIPSPMQAKSNFIARYLADVKYILSCRKALREIGTFDSIFVQSNNVAGLIIRMLRKTFPKTRIVFNIQDIFPYNAGYIGSLPLKSLPFKILNAIQRYGYRHADRLITISEDMKDQLVEAGAEAAKIDVIYNWSYQDTLYDPDEMHNEVIDGYLTPDCFNVVYAGNIGALQNVEIVVEAARILQNESGIRFHIFGDGLYKEKLAQQGEGLSNLKFWPIQPSHLAPCIYATADVNVIPLMKNIYRTALPSKTATCLACQKPIVFCLGNESKFAQEAYERGYEMTDTNNAQQLAESIVRIRNGRKPEAGEWFSVQFSKTRNSQKYAQIICQK